MDHFCNLVSSLAARRREQLYARWIHSYLAGAGSHCSDFPVDQRQTNSCLNENFSENEVIMNKDTVKGNRDDDIGEEVA